MPWMDVVSSSSCSIVEISLLNLSIPLHQRHPKLTWKAKGSDQAGNSLSYFAQARFVFLPMEETYEEREENPGPLID